jgi:hypothetical protein
MDIHKPKPWHGVREFLKEYVIIVVGVLTALAAEQAVEWLHWRHLVGEAREAVKADDSRIVALAGAVEAESKCSSQRLAQLEGVLDEASQTGRLPPLGYFRQPSGWAWSMRGWEGVVSGGVLPHIPRQEAARYVAQASASDYMRTVRDDQFAAWTSLRAMSGPGRRIGDAEIATLRQAIGRAYGDAYQFRTTAAGLIGLAQDSHLLTQTELKQAWTFGVTSHNLAACRPSEPPSSHPFELYNKGLEQPPALPQGVWEDLSRPYNTRSLTPH